MRGFTSAIARRSGSRAASRKVRYVAPACAEAEPPAGVGRRGDGQHDARAEAQAEALEAAEVRRLIGDAPSRGARRALDRAEKTAHHAHRRILQERIGPEQQPRVEHHVLEVGARTERLEEARRLACDEAACERVARPDETRRGVEVQPLPLRGRHRHRSYPLHAARGTAPRALDSAGART